MIAFGMNAFLRFLISKKWYYLTNIFGITAGLVAVGFTVLYLEHELSYDTFHPKTSNIYRISYKNKSGWFASLAKPYSNAVYEGILPEVESTIRVRRWGAQYTHVNDQKFYEQKLLITDPGSHFFDFFYFPLLEGNRDEVLQKEYSVVLSSSLAAKYFGNKSAVGEVIRLDTISLTVTGVFADLPSNTHLSFDLLITFKRAMDEASGHFIYVLLNDAPNIAALESKIMLLPIETTAFYKPEAMRLINLPDLHFEGNLTYELKPPGSISSLWILGSIGLTILLIAGTNYINLSIALYAYRSKEIAVRKSIGASSVTLTHQFLIESAAEVVLAFTLSIGIVYLLMPAFNDLMQIRVDGPFSSTGFMIVMPLLVCAIAGLATLYPTLILPRIRILDLFKSSGITSHHGLRLRKALLVVQFAVLFFVCCSTWIINDQFFFMKNKDLGFRKEGVIKIKRVWDIDSARYQRLKSVLLQHPAVIAVTEGYVPGDEDYGYQYRGENSLDQYEGLLIHSTDHDYLSTIGVRAKEGIILNEDKDQWPGKVCVINETLAKQLGYKQAVGHTITLRPGLKNERTYTIDGVVHDYHFFSLHNAVAPIMLMLHSRSNYVEENILVKVQTSRLEETLRHVRKNLEAIAPDVPAQIGFLDDDIEKMYLQEARLEKNIRILVVLSIILSLTGLVALCTYLIEFRMKEIAIRKVFGAETWNIISLFLKIFLRVVIAAFVIGGIASWFVMDRWMESFAYRIQVAPTIYLITFFGILAITFLLSILQSMRAVRINPVKLLKED